MLKRTLVIAGLALAVSVGSIPTTGTAEARTYHRNNTYPYRSGPYFPFPFFAPFFFPRPYYYVPPPPPPQQQCRVWSSRLHKWVWTVCRYNPQPYLYRRY
jgi:hypothetical protein